MTSRNAIALFFENLANYHRSENDLSDVTAAIAMTVPVIAQDICEFFDAPRAQDIKIKRECQIDDTSYRADFVFFAGGRPFFLLENKIDDENYHFKEYGDASRSWGITSLGLIGKHWLRRRDLELAEEYNWTVKRWEELFDFLTEKLQKGGCDEFQQDVVEAYLGYVKEVCKMEKLEAVRIRDESLTSLTYLNRLFQRIILWSRSKSKYEVRLLSQPKDNFGDTWSGYYYKVTNEETQKEVVSWLGIEFSKEPKIYVSVEASKNTRLFEQLNSIVAQKDELCEIAEAGEGEIGFVLPRQCYDTFMKSELKEQEDQLRVFFEHANNMFEEYLSS